MAGCDQQSDSTVSSGSPLRNRILVIRHGESESNVQNILVGNPEIGVPSYGLTEKGKIQAREAGDKLQSLLHSEHGDDLPEKLVVISSDFRRTRETAEILHAHLQVKMPIQFEEALRERKFGPLDMTAGQNYHKISELDKDDPAHTKYGNESVMSVVLRTSRLVKKLDEEYERKIILLVSHMDPLQILITTFLGISPSEHQTLPYLGNCSIRELTYEPRMK